MRLQVVIVGALALLVAESTAQGDRPKTGPRLEQTHRFEIARGLTVGLAYTRDGSELVCGGLAAHVVVIDADSYAEKRRVALGQDFRSPTGGGKELQQLFEKDSENPLSA